MIAEAVRAFLDYERFARRVTPGTERLYRFYLNRLHRFVARDESRGRPLSVRTVDRYLQYFGRRGYGAGMLDAYKVARRFLEWAYERQYLPENLTTELRRPIRRDPHRSYLGQRQIYKLLRFMGKSDRTHALRDAAILSTTYYAALRISEVLSRRPEDVDIEAGIIRVYGKGGRVREIPIVAPLRKILVRYLAARDPSSPWLFPAQAHNHAIGGRMDADNFRKALRTFYAPRAGIETRVTPHVMRRSAARILRDHSAELEVIQKILGHKHISTTMEYVGESPHRLRGSLKWL